jgi:hypothetical protein
MTTTRAASIVSAAHCFSARSVWAFEDYGRCPGLHVEREADLLDVEVDGPVDVGNRDENVFDLALHG